MGTDKAAIVVNGESLGERAARVLARVGDPVVEVGRGVTGLPSVREEPQGSGPLAAVLAGVDALQCSGPVLVLACDLPLVEAPLLRLLAEWPGDGTAVPVLGDRLQYACARYGVTSLAAARARAAAGDTSLRAAAAVDCDSVPEEVWQRVAPINALTDVDTPEDLARLGLA
jgi:molybdopterin-guanine dinucleotide biosynthesis protein A